MLRLRPKFLSHLCVGARCSVQQKKVFDLFCVNTCGGGGGCGGGADSDAATYDVGAAAKIFVAIRHSVRMEGWQCHRLFRVSARLVNECNTWICYEQNGDLHKFTNIDTFEDSTTGWYRSEPHLKVLSGKIPNLRVVFFLCVHFAGAFIYALSIEFGVAETVEIGLW